MISREEVKHIAELAHLKITEEEVDLFTEQLSAILDYIEKLDELDTEEVEPTAHAIPVKNVLREDEVKPSLSRDKVVANAPDKRDGQFAVPKIIGD